MKMKALHLGSLFRTRKKLRSFSFPISNFASRSYIKNQALVQINQSRTLTSIMANGSRSVSQYLSQIESNAKKYLEYFESRGLPEPSFDAGDGLDPRQPPPSEVIAVRDAAIEAADELHHLLLGPLGLLLSSPGDVRTSKL